MGYNIMENLKLAVKYKDTYITTILTAMANKATIPNYINKFEFTYPAKGSLTDKDWSELFLKNLIEAFVKSVLLIEDEDRYETDVEAVPIPAHGITEDIVEVGEK